MKLLAELTPLNIISLALAISGIIISLYLYQLSKREKKPVFNIKSFNLLSDQVTKVEGLEFIFKGRKINNLTLTKIALWNQGKETINSDDVAPQDKLRIQAIVNANILEYEIDYVTNPANNFRASINEDCKKISIDFDYFHNNEGIIISLYHTGKSSDAVELKGTVKSVKEIERGVFHLGKYQDAIGNKFVWRFRPLVRISIFPIVIIPFIIANIIDTFLHIGNKIPKEFELDS